MQSLQKKRLLIFEIFNIKKCTLFFFFNRVYIYNDFRTLKTVWFSFKKNLLGQIIDWIISYNGALHAVDLKIKKGFGVCQSALTKQADIGGYFSQKQ